MELVTLFFTSFFDLLGITLGVTPFISLLIVMFAVVTGVNLVCYMIWGRY